MRSFKNLDTLQVVGLFLSVAVAILTWVLSPSRDPIPSITLGFVLAILTQGLDLQKRLNDAEERLLQANALSRILYEDQWLLGHVQKIVQGYQSVKRGWFWWYQLRATNAVVQCRNTLQSLEEGYMVADPRSASNFGTEVSQKAKKSIKAVDLGPNVFPWWRSADGQEYIRSNAETVRRKVKVTRIFIQPINVLREAIDVLEKQASVGIEVYVAQREELPKELCQDYVIVDDRVFSYTEFTDRGDPREERISIDK